MYNLYLYMILYTMFVSGVISFCMLRKHILLTLLSLDYIGVSIFFMYVNFLLDLWGDMYIILMFLVFMVCEAVLGLSILVGMIRCHGSDHVNSLFLL